MEKDPRLNTEKNNDSVFALTRPSRCYSCDGKQTPGDLVRLKEGQDELEVLCGHCAGLDSFAIVPAGNAKMTRLAKKQASACYIILKWSELWKTYERQGLLIDAEAAVKIEKETGAKFVRLQRP